MSSGQWEVVGKSKKSQNGKVKNNKEDDKKPFKNGPKLEDVVPHSQIKSFYAGMEIDDDRKPAKENKKKEGGGKTKKQSQDKKSEPPKPKPPKTIEDAFQLIDPKQLTAAIKTTTSSYPNTPMIWCENVTKFLDSETRIEVDDPTFSNYAPTYPLSVLPVETKNILENFWKEVKSSCDAKFQQNIYDQMISNLIYYMKAGLTVNGHRLFLQMLAQDNPELCTGSIQKSISHFHSYQNRPSIGLTLLWAFGQGGLSNFAVGLKAWQELFLPLIELKSYSKYVVLYLTKLMDRHANNESVTVSQEQLLAMFDMVNNKKNGLSKELLSDLMKQLSKYKDIYFNKSGGKLQVTFNQLMKKLPNQYFNKSTLNPYNKVLVESLVDCLARDDSCNATWRQLFHKCSKQSATLIDYIDCNWSEVSPRLKLKSLKVTVIQYKEISGDALKGKKKDENVIRTNKICQNILDRMTSTRRFPWLWAIFFVLVGIAGLLAYDVSRVYGNFPKSATGRFLNDIGVLEQSQRAWQKTLSTSARGYLWLETNAPIYYTQVVEVCKPYSQLSKDLITIAVKKIGFLYDNINEYVREKTPVVVATIDHYAPGLIDNVQGYAVAGIETVKKYSSDYYHLTNEYLKTKVFVGEWAPEILQNKTQNALDVIRIQVTSYFHWFRKQVHVYSEIP